LKVSFKPSEVEAKWTQYGVPRFEENATQLHDERITVGSYW
jgi:hypothetical protein